MTPRTKPPDLFRFMSRVDTSNREGCWEWEHLGDGRYGHFGFKAGRMMAHRAAWTLFKGKIPRGLHVLHRCDNGACVRLSHLFLGTHADNMRDAAQKGRIKASRVRGERQHAARLTEADVRMIRSSRESHAALGRALRVSPDTVRLARKGVTWTHVSESHQGELRPRPLQEGEL